jgi:hypothetical protein
VSRSVFGLQLALQRVFSALHPGEQRSIVWILPLFASWHALTTRGEHLTCVLFPNGESFGFFFQREIDSSLML